MANKKKPRSETAAKNELAAFCAFWALLIAGILFLVKLILNVVEANLSCQSYSQAKHDRSNHAWLGYSSDSLQVCKRQVQGLEDSLLGDDYTVFRNGYMRQYHFQIIV